MPIEQTQQHTPEQLGDDELEIEPETSPEVQTMVEQISQSIKDSQEFADGLGRLAKDQIFAGDRQALEEILYQEVGKGKLGKDEAPYFQRAGRGLKIRHALLTIIGAGGSDYALRDKNGLLVDSRKLNFGAQQALDEDKRRGIKHSVNGAEKKEASESGQVELAPNQPYWKKYELVDGKMEKTYIGKRAEKEAIQIAADVLNRRLDELTTKDGAALRQTKEKIEKDEKLAQNVIRGLQEEAQARLAKAQKKQEKLGADDPSVKKEQAKLEELNREIVELQGKSQSELETRRGLIKDQQIALDNELKVIREPLEAQLKDIEKPLGDLSSILERVTDEEATQSEEVLFRKKRISSFGGEKELMESLGEGKAEWAQEMAQLQANSDALKAGKRDLEKRIAELQARKREAEKTLARIDKIGKTPAELSEKQAAKQKPVAGTQSAGPVVVTRSEDYNLEFPDQDDQPAQSVGGPSVGSQNKTHEVTSSQDQLSEKYSSLMEQMKSLKEQIVSEARAGKAEAVAKKVEEVKQIVGQLKANLAEQVKHRYITQKDADTKSGKFDEIIGSMNRFWLIARNNKLRSQRENQVNQAPVDTEEPLPSNDYVEADIKERGRINQEGYAVADTSRDIPPEQSAEEMAAVDNWADSEAGRQEIENKDKEAERGWLGVIFKRFLGRKREKQQEVTTTVNEWYKNIYPNGVADARLKIWQEHFRAADQGYNIMTKMSESQVEKALIKFLLAANSAEHKSGKGKFSADSAERLATRLLQAALRRMQKGKHEGGPSKEKVAAAKTPPVAPPPSPAPENPRSTIVDLANAFDQGLQGRGTENTAPPAPPSETSAPDRTKTEPETPPQPSAEPEATEAETGQETGESVRLSAEQLLDLLGENLRGLNRAKKGALNTHFGLSGRRLAEQAAEKFFTLQEAKTAVAGYATSVSGLPKAQAEAMADEKIEQFLNKDKK
ncbi:MAG: hypothetical protein PHS62_00755 [Patescibacteria group bacterium]|nr:hypothetical protein [Patescibacteria group bacterium]